MQDDMGELGLLVLEKGYGRFNSGLPPSLDKLQFAQVSDEDAGLIGCTTCWMSLVLAMSKGQRLGLSERSGNGFSALLSWRRPGKCGWMTTCLMCCFASRCSVTAPQLNYNWLIFLMNCFLLVTHLFHLDRRRAMCCTAVTQQASRLLHCQRQCDCPSMHRHCVAAIMT